MKSLKDTLRKEIYGRITAVTALAVGVIILASGFRINSTLRAWETSVASQADDLGAQVLSEILVGNQESIEFILRAFMASNEPIEARWSPVDSGLEGLTFHFPDSWGYQKRLVTNDGHVGGVIVFSKRVDLAHLLWTTLGSEILVVLLISGLLLLTLAPLATTVPRRLVLAPLQAILGQLQEYKNSGRVIHVPSDFAEVEALLRQIGLLMEEHRLLQDMTIDAERNAAVARMTQMLAHDVRKPFTILRMGLGMLGGANDQARVKQILSRLVPEIDKAVSSVDGLIADVMEVGSTSTQLIQERASPESLIESSLGEVFRIYPKSNISITYNLNHTHMAHVHVLKVGRVLSNIVGNAVQAMGYKGNIWFKTREHDGFIEFCLGNAGSVIPAESLPKLFEAFFTSGKKGGTGLGLAIAEKVVKAHGGRIWCESSKTLEHPDGKVEFFFTLPIAHGCPVISTATLPRHSSKITETLQVVPNELNEGSIDKSELNLETDITQVWQRTLSPLRVLVVDDESVYRNALAAYLSRTPELTKALSVVLASNSDEALSAMGNDTYDLIITDVDMGPDSLDGFELIQEMRSRETKSLICVHSNRIVATDHQAAYAAGASAFLPKPMARAQLLRLVLQAGGKRSWTEMTVQAPPSPYARRGAVNAKKQKPEVLVIDDSRFVLDAWICTLSADATVHVMTSLEELCDRHAAEPDFLGGLNYVITDMHLDGSAGDGLDIGRLVKKVRPNLRVLLSSDGVFGDSELVGAVDRVISKNPVSFSVLTVGEPSLGH